ncbi:MAG TPA: hypothetical protein VLA98_14450 [Solirubrobacteraceae bacterium]|nr:hypothetical protein [Solirubrobacteraceae bacterium]
MRRLAVLLAACALAAPAAASADPYAPPAGAVLTGVAAGEGAAAFDAQVRHRSEVFQSFVSFGYTGAGWAFTRAAATGAHPMLHVSTIAADDPEVITPGAIARGRGDGYLLWLNGRMARVGGPVYVRLLAEMNGHWNPYSAFDASGRARGRDHSTAAFRAAWRRVALILRGGEVAAIDARLAALHLPPVRTAAAALPAPQVALMWVPQVAGAPDIRANAPAAYWPGRAYVDWVGTDFYSRFPNFAGLERFAAGRRWRGLPFAFGEWAVWGADDPGFVHRLFTWVRRHRQVRMLVYNQGLMADGPFRLRHYPRALAALRSELRALR